MYSTPLEPIPHLLSPAVFVVIIMFMTLLPLYVYHIIVQLPAHNYICWSVDAAPVYMCDSVRTSRWYIYTLCCLDARIKIVMFFLTQRGHSHDAQCDKVCCNVLWSHIVTKGTCVAHFCYVDFCPLLMRLVLDGATLKVEPNSQPAHSVYVFIVFMITVPRSTLVILMTYCGIDDINDNFARALVRSIVRSSIYVCRSFSNSAGVRPVRNSSHIKNPLEVQVHLTMDLRPSDIVASMLPLHLKFGWVGTLAHLPISIFYDPLVRRERAPKLRITVKEIGLFLNFVYPGIKVHTHDATIACLNANTTTLHDRDT